MKLETINGKISIVLEEGENLILATEEEPDKTLTVKNEDGNLNVGNEFKSKESEYLSSMLTAEEVIKVCDDWL